MTDLPTQVPPTSAATTCPSCGSAAEPGASFCESCGSALPAGSVLLAAVTPNPETDAAPVELTRPTSVAAPAAAPLPTPRCLACGGEVGPDGYCTTCGTLAPSPRDHYVEQPAGWVAACCDKGIKHHRNEDATAVAADPEPGSRAVLVVCDGVSTSADSDVASLAAARRARDVLVALQPAGLGTPASRAAAIAAALDNAVAQANEAVVETTAPDSDNAASCTFAGAVLEGDLLVFGNVGDSRVYWLPDPAGPPAGPAPAPRPGVASFSSALPTELSLDDSMAQARIAMGVSREEAENGPQAHAITKWLGRDSPDFRPRTGSVLLDRPGWVLVCSDGLWNYASTAETLQALVGELTAGPAAPLDLAEALVGWANAQGGRDNISVALARH